MATMMVKIKTDMEVGTMTVADLVAKEAMGTIVKVDVNMVAVAITKTEEIIVANTATKTEVMAEADSTTTTIATTAIATVVVATGTREAIIMEVGTAVDSSTVKLSSLTSSIKKR